MTDQIKETPRKTVELMLSSKGGIGKTANSLFLMEYYMKRKNLSGKEILVVDCDSRNPKLSQTNYNNIYFQIRDIKQASVDKKKLNLLFEEIIDQDAQRIIVDPGGAGYDDMLSYMLNMGAARIVTEVGKRDLIIHLPIAAHDYDPSDASADFTMSVMAGEKVTYVLWLSEYKQEFEKDYKETLTWQNNENKIGGVVSLPYRSWLQQETHEMLATKQTLNEYLASDKPVMEKSAVQNYFELVFDQLDQAKVL